MGVPVVILQSTISIDKDMALARCYDRKWIPCGRSPGDKGMERMTTASGGTSCFAFDTSVIVKFSLNLVTVKHITIFRNTFVYCIKMFS